MHEGLSLISRTHVKMSDVVACTYNPSTDKKIPGAHRPTSLSQGETIPWQLNLLAEFHINKRYPEPKERDNEKGKNRGVSEHLTAPLASLRQGVHGVLFAF